MKINYRKIYESHYGPIPNDENGRTYDIHHIDGNHSNNDPTNLKAVTIQEHYDAHYIRKEWYACSLIAFRMKLSPAELSNLNTELQLKRVADGTHPFLGGEISRKHNQERLLNKTHHLLKRTDGTSIASDRAEKGLLPIQLATKDGKNPWQKRVDGSSFQQDLVKLGKHHLLGGSIQKKQIDDGTHPSKIKVSCLCCKKIFSKNAYSQHHGIKCKQYKYKNNNV